jgi:hypothetical protein
MSDDVSVPPSIVESLDVPSDAVASEFDPSGPPFASAATPPPHEQSARNAIAMRNGRPGEWHMGTSGISRIA